jgi:2-pyrone-4,6-dicarboxylate lactonase
MSSYLATPGKPKLKLPAGACDTHFHVFGPARGCPYAPERAYTPVGEAPKEKLFALHGFLGLERGVVVQSNAHGLDNSASADLIAARPASYRGIALVAPAVSDAELKTLDAQGFRGARFHFMKHLGRATGIDEILALAKRLAQIGWHLQIHLESTLIPEMAGALKRSPVPIVIDHMGRIDASLGPQQKPFRDLVELLKNPHIWVKVSGSERASRQPSPWRDAVPFAKRLVAEFGDRTLWGTDWPHPNLKEVPDDGVLVDLLSEIAPSETQRKALLVDNPQRFYGFSS